MQMTIHQMQIWQITRKAQAELHESEFSEAFDSKRVLERSMLSSLSMQFHLFHYVNKLFFA